MPEFNILVDNCGVQNKNIAMIRFLNMIKEVGLFGIATFCIKGHTKNDRDRKFNSIKVLYGKQNVLNFENCCQNFNTRKNVEVIKMFHENFFDLG